MIAIRKASERGHLDYGWLKANYTFSFASYFDPAHMGFRSLRVMNNDYIAGGGGFETHPHKNMEIITFILKGSLEHRDTMGNHSVIKAGEIQVMSAGTGVFHSEFNPSKSDSTELYQIWIKPNTLNTEPSYQQQSFRDSTKLNKFVELVSNKEKSGVATIHQDASINYGKFKKEVVHIQSLNPTKGYWFQIVSGAISINEKNLMKEDGFSVESLDSVELVFKEDSEILMFELS